MIFHDFTIMSKVREKYRVPPPSAKRFFADPVRKTIASPWRPPNITAENPPKHKKRVARVIGFRIVFHYMFEWL